MIETLIKRFVLGIGSFALILTSVADLSSNLYGFWSLGFDPLSHVVLAVMGLVVTGSVILGWSKGWPVLAYSGSIFSAFLMLSVFLAVIDQEDQMATRSNAVSITKSAEKSPLDSQIEQALSNVNAITAKRDAPDVTVSQYLRLDKAVKDANTALDALRVSKDQETANLKQTQASPDMEPVLSLSLSAWKIFGELPNFQWSDSAHVVALAVLIFLSGLIQVILSFTVPRIKAIEPPKVEKVIEVRKPRRWGKKEFSQWASWTVPAGGKVVSPLELSSLIDLKKARFPIRWAQEMEKRAKELKILSDTGDILVSVEDAKAIIQGVK